MYCRYLAVVCSLADCVHGDDEDSVWGERVRIRVPVPGLGSDLVMHVRAAFYREEFGLRWGIPVENTHINRHIMTVSISL